MLKSFVVMVIDMKMFKHAFFDGDEGEKGGKG